MDGSRIDAVLIETKSGRGAIRGRTFLDCSGDADLAMWAGAPYALGGEDGFVFVAEQSRKAAAKTAA